MTTGDRIRRLRERAQLSQRDLQARTDISQSTIARIESGDRAVKPYELSAFAAALGCLESSLMDSHPVRDRLQYAARTNIGCIAETEFVKDHLFYLLEMDTYLRRALATKQPA